MSDEEDSQTKRGKEFYRQKNLQWQQNLKQAVENDNRLAREIDLQLRAFALPEWAGLVGEDAVENRSGDPRIGICHDILDLDGKAEQCVAVMRRFAATPAGAQDADYHLPVAMLVQSARECLRAATEILGRDPVMAAQCLKQAGQRMQATQKALHMMMEAIPAIDLDALRETAQGTPSSSIVPVDRLPLGYFRLNVNRQLLGMMAEWEPWVARMMHSVSALPPKALKQSASKPNLAMRLKRSRPGQATSISPPAKGTPVDDAKRGTRQSIMKRLSEIQGLVGALPEVEAGECQKTLLAVWSGKDSGAVEGKALIALSEVKGRLDNCASQPPALAVRIQALIEECKSLAYPAQAGKGQGSSTARPLRSHRRIGSSPGSPSNFSPLASPRGLGQQAKNPAPTGVPGPARKADETGIRKNRANSQPALPVFRDAHPVKTAPAEAAVPARRALQKPSLTRTKAKVIRRSSPPPARIPPAVLRGSPADSEPTESSSSESGNSSSSLVSEAGDSDS
jgi:hypothetical protein